MEKIERVNSPSIEDHVAVQVLGFNGDKDSVYRHMLDGNHPKLEWEIHRLLWIGYNKNEHNDNCIFGKLSKDIIKNIVKYFFIDMDSMDAFVKLTLPQQATFEDVVTYYSKYLVDNRKTIVNPSDTNHSIASTIHIWCSYNCVRKEYPLPIKASKIQKISPKWVRIPQCFAKKLKFKSENVNFELCDKIYLEFCWDDFPYHGLSLIECLNLRVHDKIDHRYVQLSTYTYVCFECV